LSSQHPADPSWGKAPSAFLESVVYRNLGAKRPNVVVGPAKGFDNAVIDVGMGKLLVATTDPVSVIPRLGEEASAWLSVHLIASDYTTSGLSPEYAAFDFNFPAEMTGPSRESYLKAVGASCKELGVTIVAGHTGSYPGAGFTVVGGGTMFGLGRKGRCLDPSLSKPGDAIVMTKGAAIEATASLAGSFPVFTAMKLGKGMARRARGLVRSCTTVKDALVSAGIGIGKGGVTSMHDATEGGVLGGLSEMAAASGNSMRVDRGLIPVPDEAREVCGAFGIDPLTSLSEGTLLITCDRGRAGELEKALAGAGIRSATIGSVGSGGGLWLSEKGGRPRRTIPGVDGYWSAYSRGMSAGLL
jgi:hydrogenase maturation factor